MKKSEQNKIAGRQGFALLMTIIIVSALGLGLAAALLASSAAGVKETRIAEQSYQAASLADACAETALENLANSSSYIGNANITLGSGTCTYTVSAFSGSVDVINASSTVSTTIRKTQIYISIPQLTISSWQEVGDF